MQEVKAPEKWKRTNGVDRMEMRRGEKRLRSAWSTGRKFMRRHKGTADILRGMEHRLRREAKDSATEKPRKDGGLQPAQQEIRRRWQAMRIASTHQEEFFLQLTVFFFQTHCWRKMLKT